MTERPRSPDARAERRHRRRTVLFVCLHGALRSRLAEAFFNASPPRGWRAVSAGIEPQAGVSAVAAGLVAGTPAAGTLDASPPRSAATAGRAARRIAIDCELSQAERWDLEYRDPGPAMRDEIAARIRALAAEIARG